MKYIIYQNKSPIYLDNILVFFLNNIDFNNYLINMC